MTTVKDIEKAISSLPPEKLSLFRSWYEKFDAACWDKQLKYNIKAGKLNQIAERVTDHYRRGKCKEL